MPSPTLNIPSVQHLVSEAEWQMRVDLAAAYRLVALFGWDDLIFTHLTAKIPGTEFFLINPYGMMFDEITASSLVKIDLNGEKIMASDFDINPAGFIIHSCIHAGRSNAKCVIHVHSVNGIAVSAQVNGLLPISQQAFIVLDSIAYHDYEGIAVNEGEKPRLVANLGDKKYFMLRNHGLLTVGESVAEAFVAMHKFESACMVQVRAQAGGELIHIAPEILALAGEQVKKVRNGKGADLAWPGLLRRLDRNNPGYDS
jgi:ribulose-5-phosphate 4-epimerase/fuculose-1-phosphate aldolase